VGGGWEGEDEVILRNVCRRKPIRGHTGKLTIRESEIEFRIPTSLIAKSGSSMCHRRGFMIRTNSLRCLPPQKMFGVA
jgi:hypothetical protein